ncbi:MAG: hypothetical protein LQ340_004375 [Diploschistes diacapsis]|nr:MAG: hypothetical protein LQ340_004375 [Diploschistes diacapsis]
MSSAATRRPRPSRLPSGRPSSSLEDEESGQNGDTARIPSDQRFTEEIEEIKRYEDFTTIDWVQDAAREQVRRSIRKKENFELKRRSGFWNVKQKIWELYDAGEAWIVVTLVGIAIGVNAAVLNIVTEWMSDIKLGYCETAFYLNRNFCCWGVDNPEDGWPKLPRQEYQ